MTRTTLSSRSEQSASYWTDFRPSREMIETSACRYIAVCSASGLFLFARYQSLAHIGPEAAGLLQACMGIALSVSSILNSANALYFIPYVNRAVSAENKIGMASAFLPRILCLYALGALPIVLFPKLVLHLLFSASFVSAAPSLVWFIGWQLLSVFANVYQQLLVGLNDERGYAFGTAAGNLVGAVVCVGLVRIFGLVGIAAGFVAGGVATVVLTAFQLRSGHRVSILSRIPILAAFMAAGFLGLAFLNRVGEETTSTGIGLRLLVTVVFLGGVWWLLPKSLRDEWSAAGRAKIQLLIR